MPSKDGEPTSQAEAKGLGWGIGAGLAHVESAAEHEQQVAAADGVVGPAVGVAADEAEAQRMAAAPTLSLSRTRGREIGTGSLTAITVMSSVMTMTAEESRSCMATL